MYITGADKKGVPIVSINWHILFLLCIEVSTKLWSLNLKTLQFQVRHVDKGVNPVSAAEIFFSGKYLAPGIRIGVLAGMIALTVRKNFHI